MGTFSAAAADVWALGIILYLLVSGIYPFEVRVFWALGDQGFRALGLSSLMDDGDHRPTMQYVYIAARQQAIIRQECTTRKEEADVGLQANCHYSQAIGQVTCLYHSDIKCEIPHTLI